MVIKIVGIGMRQTWTRLIDVASSVKTRAVCTLPRFTDVVGTLSFSPDGILRPFLGRNAIYSFASL